MRADAVLVACAGTLALFAADCRKKIDYGAGAPPAGALEGATGLATTTAATPDDDGQWTMPGKDWANTRFSTFLWDENAYASIVWSHVRPALRRGRRGRHRERAPDGAPLQGTRREEAFRDIEANALFWGFIVLVWWPFSLLFMIDGAIR